MGNCLALQQDRIIRVMKRDGKIIEYQAPLRARQVLFEFPGHEISDGNQPLASTCLHPAANMLTGHLYHLVPQTIINKRTVLPSASNLKMVLREETSAIRIKLVITKKELRDMLEKGGISVDDNEKVFKLKNKQYRESFDAASDDADGVTEQRCKGWRPMLQSIPE